jgi:hypothetical protein
MHLHTSWLGCSIVLCGLLFRVGVVWADQDHQHQQSAHIQASGVVTKVTKTGITLKTPAADVTLNVNATERSGLTHVKVGDELTVWINEDNIVVDVHTKGHQREHRLITGKLAYSDPAKSQMKLWTPEGVRSFPIKLEEARLQNIPEGTNVTVEIDEQGRLMDIHKN